MRHLTILLLFFLWSCHKDNSSSTTQPSNLQIGQSYQGGIIFYLDATGQHGLIAAPADQSTSSQWQLNYQKTGSIQATAIGIGSSNTTSIINICGSGSYAASICRNYKGSGYNDWFLPSKDELNLMYLNLKKQNLGSFSNVYYWSSSSDPASGLNCGPGVVCADVLVWMQNFQDGQQNSDDKNDSFPHTRAVRAF